MDMMQTDLASAPFTPTPIETYARNDTINSDRAVIFLAQNYPIVSGVRQEMHNKKTFSSFISAHLRILVSLGFLLMIGLSLLGTSGLAGGTLQQLIQKIRSLPQSPLITNQNIALTAHSSLLTNASQHLVRISQLDPNQYASPSEYNTWAYSACSAAALTEVFNSFGSHVRVTDVLRIESQIGEISPDLGLIEPSGIARTATKFGFTTQWGNNGSLDQIIAVANSGKPVIVGFPPDRYEGGHILTVIGGNNESVFLADTSLWNRHEISRTQFLQWWGGYYAIVTPS